MIEAVVMLAIGLSMAGVSSWQSEQRRVRLSSKAVAAFDVDFLCLHARAA